MHGIVSFWINRLFNLDQLKVVDMCIADMDFNKLCDEILKIDHQVRYAGVYNTQSGRVFEKMGKGRDRMLNPEQTKNSLIHAYMRWKLRQQFAEAVGEPVFAMTKYEKINRMTVPCGKDSLLNITTEKELEPYQIIDNVLNLIEKYSDDPNYAPRASQLSF